jgi:hypothetical protein
METALGMAHWLLGQVLNKLSDDLVKAYVSSTELGSNLEKIEREMLFTRGLLDRALKSDVTGDLNLQRLLERLGKKADEAEDALDELQYFMIQDKHDGTREATLELGGSLAAQAQHVRHAARHTAGNWLSCFSSCCPRNDHAAATPSGHGGKLPFDRVATSELRDGLGAKAQHAHHAARHTSGNWLSCFSCCQPRDDVAAADAIFCDRGHVGKLPFDRVALSDKIKLLIEKMHSYCTPISKLLDKTPMSNLHMPASIKRPDTSSQITQDKLFGRDAIFQKTIDDIIIAKDSGKTLSVLPMVGPGGIGKTTFAQHLYNHTRIKEHFTVRVWICVSTNFDVLRLTKEILSCLPATENAEDKTANETTYSRNSSNRG